MKIGNNMLLVIFSFGREVLFSNKLIVWKRFKISVKNRQQLNGTRANFPKCGTSACFDAQVEYFHRHTYFCLGWFDAYKLFSRKFLKIASNKK